jgi:hypothetical protein
MKLSYHNVVHPRPGLAGLLVVDDDDEAFDYVPVVGVPRGAAFAQTLQGGLDAGTSPRRLLRYFLDKGGPHLYESLSFYEPIDGDTRKDAIARLAREKGWEMDWDAASSAPVDPPREPAREPARDPPSPPPPAPSPWQGEPPFPGLSRSLKQALVFQTLALLIRRHHASLGLRLMELHPCGGMYDCLALVTAGFEQSLCLLNLAGTGLLLKPLDTPRPPPDADEEWHKEVWEYPREYFAAGGADAFADRLEGRLGLPSGRPLPPASPTTVSVAVLAQLAQRFALSDRAPCFRSGWLDTSGMEGSSVRSWVSEFPELMARCEAAEPGSREPAQLAGRLWGIGPGRFFEQPDLVVDLATGELRRKGKKEGSLWSRYAQGAGIRELAWWVETLWKKS